MNAPTNPMGTASAVLMPGDVLSPDEEVVHIGSGAMSRSQYQWLIDNDYGDTVGLFFGSTQPPITDLEPVTM